MRIAFLGLGIMGSRMAANLRRSGHQLTVWNRTAQTARAFAAEHDGVAVAASPQAAATEAELVFTMVVDGPQVQDIVRRAMPGATPGTVFVDCSTIGPPAALAAGALLAAGGMRFLDAPVTGSAPRAADGTLTFMVGGARGDFELTLPALQAMGELIVHAGPLGHGQLVKVINNALAAVHTAAAAEALLTGAAAGADLDALVRVVGAGSGASAMLALKSGPMRAHDYTPLFKLEHMLKDVRLCLEQAATGGVEFGFARRAEQVLARSQALGHGADDFAALLEPLQEDAGRRL